jgi:hypothetical protein
VEARWVNGQQVEAQQMEGRLRAGARRKRGAMPTAAVGRAAGTAPPTQAPHALPFPPAPSPLTPNL